MRTLFEIRNSKDAFRELLLAFDKKLPLDKSLICSLHEQLTKNTYDSIGWSTGKRPGTFKKNDYVVGIDEVGALPQDVEVEIDELLEEINEFNGKGITKAAAYFHVKFENIHPFADGNGRVGRLTLNYFLLTHNYPPVIIFENHGKFY